MRTLAAVLLALACLAAGAAADDGYDLGARALYYVPADAEEGTFNPAAHARWRFNERWSLEGLASYQRHLFPETTVHTAAFQASALRYFGAGRGRLFGLAGAGAFFSRTQGPQYRRNLGRFAPHAGLGAELAVTPEWLVEAEYRHVWLGHLQSRDASGDLRRWRRSGEQVSLGLTRRY